MPKDVVCVIVIFRVEDSAEAINYGSEVVQVLLRKFI